MFPVNQNFTSTSGNRRVPVQIYSVGVCDTQKKKEEEPSEIADGERPQKLLAILASTIVSSDGFNFLLFG